VSCAQVLPLQIMHFCVRKINPMYNATHWSSMTDVITQVWFGAQFQFNQLIHSRFGFSWLSSAVTEHWVYIKFCLRLGKSPTKHTDHLKLFTTPSYVHDFKMVYKIKKLMWRLWRWSKEWTTVNCSKSGSSCRGSLTGGKTPANNPNIAERLTAH
jgi:hypothetical protein